MTDEDISAEDRAFLKLLKEEVKSTPKGDVQGVKDWMRNYLASTGELEPKPEHSDEPSKTSKDNILRMRDPPRITNFSGNNNKGETSYELWRYEVCGLQQDKLYDPENINYAVRRSLKGDAGMIAMHLGPKASLPEIIHKLDSVYGAVESKEDLLATFYRARQEEDESVTKWSCRLEYIIGKAVDKQIVQKRDTNSMLHSMLWAGLKPELKDVSGHKYDSIKDFDELRIALRQIERDHEDRKTTKKPQPARAITTSAENTSQPNENGELKGMIQQLTTRFDRLERTYHNNKQDGYYRGSYNQQPQRQERQWRPRSQRQLTSTSRTETEKANKIVCYRCGQEGHKKIGCANPPNSHKDLNRQKPMEQGRH